LTGELSTYVGSGEQDPARMDGAEPVSKDEANLFAPSSVCLDPTTPDRILMSTDDTQKVIRSMSTIEGIKNLCSIFVFSLDSPASYQRNSTPAGKVTIEAGQINFEEPAPEDQQKMNEWVERCLEAKSSGTQACFSDIASLVPGKLNNQEDPLVYVSCMSSNIIRSYNPKTSMFAYKFWFTHAFKQISFEL
jgi:hypothetical protein